MNVQTANHAVGLGKSITPSAGSNNTLVRLGVSVSGRLGLMVGKSGATDIPVTPLATREVKAIEAHHPAPLGRV